GERGPELKHLEPLLAVQARLSVIPRQDECLIEYIESREGHHLFVYPFEGRVVHEILGALLAWRIARLTPLSFSIAMNDYGLELLCDQEIPLDEALEAGLFSPDKLDEDLHHSLNQTEMGVRKFREVARVAGLVFQGFPGRQAPTKHLHASTSLLYQVFRDYDPGNLLLQQTEREVIDYQIDIERLRAALTRLQGQHLHVTRPGRFTPFAFPIMVDRLRERLSTEKLADRIGRMQVQLKGR
ncbi:MAG: DNA ligase-associated DEXH box helicase, partial [Bacteroidetes bacterium]